MSFLTRLFLRWGCWGGSCCLSRGIVVLCACLSLLYFLQGNTPNENAAAAASAAVVASAAVAAAAAAASAAVAAALIDLCLLFRLRS